jgi:hypothetical protein
MFVSVKQANMKRSLENSHETLLAFSALLPSRIYRRRRDRDTGISMGVDMGREEGSERRSVGANINSDELAELLAVTYAFLHIPLSIWILDGCVDKFNLGEMRAGVFVTRVWSVSLRLFNLFDTSIEKADERRRH